MLDTHTATIPVHVNVAPGDVRAGRAPGATVRSELAFQRAQRAKEDAGEAIREGDVRRASALYEEAGEALDAFKPTAAAVRNYPTDLPDPTEMLRAEGAFV